MQAYTEKIGKVLCFSRKLLDFLDSEFTLEGGTFRR